MKVKINRAQIKATTEKSFNETALLLGAAFTKAISDPVYSWPSGDSPRDIVDKGELRSSQRMIQAGRLNVLFVWGKNYSAAVHNGVTLRNGTTLPARPWTEIALQRFDVESAMAKLFARYS